MYYDVEKPSSSNGLGIVLVVSGGFVSGEDNLNMMRAFWEVLLTEGYTLFQLYHPAHPRYRIPDAFESLKLGVQHIRANADSFGVDGERLGIFGVSSGGFFSLLLGLSSDSREHSAPSFAAIVALMPLVDVHDRAFDTELFGVHYRDFDPELYAGVSPINYVSSADPPTLLIHGSRDAAVSFEANSGRMKTLLDDAGVQNRLLSVDAGHEVFPEPLLGAAQAAILDWLRQHL